VGPEVREEGVDDGAGSARSASTPHESFAPDGEDGELEDDESDDGELRVRPFWARTSTLVVFVVVLFVLSGAVTAWLRISDLQDRADRLEAQTLAADEGRQTATALAEDLATYDYRDLGGNFRLVRASATDDFAAQLAELTEELGPELQTTRAVASATVRAAGVVRASDSEVVVAVFVDQTVTNTKSPTPRTERSRMQLTLVKQEGVWRLDQAGEL
jgi:Mce-associated membrane protein